MWNESKCESKLHAQVRREMKDPEMLSQVVYAFANIAVKNARSQVKQKS
jgi:hypothetical protein